MKKTTDKPVKKPVVKRTPKVVDNALNEPEIASINQIETIETIEDEVIDLTQINTQEEQKLPLRGLGDVIAKLTKFLGIDTCEGCQSRQSGLNGMFPFLNPKRLLTHDEMKTIERIGYSTSIVNVDVNFVFGSYNELFSTKLEKCSCPGLISKLIERLDNLRKAQL